MPKPNMNPDDLKGLTLLGQSGVGATKQLETFPVPVSARQSKNKRGVGLVRFVAPEFTSLCPVTNQPDFGTITIEYVPNGFCVESKSLKLYLQTYREEASFWEALAMQIRDDLIEALDPLWIRVTTFQNPRGGISLESTSAWSRRDGNLLGEGSYLWPTE